MVSFSDLKLYKSAATGSIGGSIDLGEPIQTSTPNNLFENFTRAELLAGSTKYRCMFLKNESSEKMENFQIWLSSVTPLANTGVDFGFDTSANPLNGAIGFDGVNDELDCGNHTDLWSKALTKFSFSIDIYPILVGDGNFRTVVYHSGGSNNGFQCYIDQTDGELILFHIKSSGGSDFFASSDQLVLFDWNRVVCSYDSTLGSNNLKIFVDGVLGTNPAGGSPDFTGSINASADLTIARDSNDFKGYCRDFRFWDNDSINSDKAEELQDDDEIEDQPESYHLKFSERTGITTKDAVSRTKTASLDNGTFWKTTAETLADETISPDIYNNTWYSGGEKPPKFGLKADQEFPIWIRLIADQDVNATPHIDDNCVFSVSFDIESTGTSSGGTGGTGGGTGGNTGGSTGTSNYSIAVSGDWGNTGDTDDVLDLIRDEDYDLVLGVGDNAYDDSSASSWCNKFRFLRDKMESAWGNHEYEEDGGTSPYKSFFGYSRSYHSHRFQNCLILILDSNDDKSGVDLNEQRTWAKAELEKYKNDTNVVWRIAVMHHPWFGDGSKHTENEFDQVQKFHKLFTDYDVNFVYTGHNHHWVRSHQVSYNSSNPESPHTVDSSSPYSRSGNGLIYIVSGTGGHDSGGDLYSLPDDESFFAYRNKSQNGVHELVASNNGNTLTGRFRNVNGNTSDTFVINA